MTLEVTRTEVFPCHICKGTGWIKLSAQAVSSCWGCEASAHCGPAVAHNACRLTRIEGWSNWQYVMMNADPFNCGEWCERDLSEVQGLIAEYWRSHPQGSGNFADI